MDRSRISLLLFVKSTQYEVVTSSPVPRVVSQMDKEAERGIGKSINYTSNQLPLMATIRVEMSNIAIVNVQKDASPEDVVSLFHSTSHLSMETTFLSCIYIRENISIQNKSNVSSVSFHIYNIEKSTGNGV